MIRRICFSLLLASAASFGAQSSGFYGNINVSRGIHLGDKFQNFAGTEIGSVVGDTVYYVDNGREGKKKFDFIHTKSSDFQYGVRFSALVGYEKSWNKILSARGAVGYQNVVLDAYAASIPGFALGDMTQVPFITSKISRHWLSVPVDVKFTAPLSQNGVYLAVGPKLSFLLATQYTDSITTTTIDLAGRTPGVNLSLGLRLGAEFAVGTLGYFFIEAGYHHGLTNLAVIAPATTGEGEAALLGIGFRSNFSRSSTGGR